LLLIYTVKEDLRKHTPIVEPYYRLITMTEPGLKVSKNIIKNYKYIYNLYIDKYILVMVQILRKKSICTIVN
jgi:hypothetical protein